MNTFAMWIGYAVMVCSGIVATAWFFFWCLDVAFQRLKLMPLVFEFIRWKREAKREAIIAATETKSSKE